MRFEVAEHDWNPVALGKPVDLLMQHSLQFEAGLMLAAVESRGHLRHALFVPAAAGSIRPCARRRAKGHLMEPRPQRIANPEVAGFLDQNEERGLERVLGVVGVDKLGAANAQDHCAVALDDRLERQFGDLARAGRKPLE